MMRLIAALAVSALLAPGGTDSRVVILSNPGTQVVWEGVQLGETNTAGVLIVDDVPHGSYVVELSRSGYVSERVTLEIVQGEHTLERRLKPTALSPQARPREPRSVPEPRQSTTPKTSPPPPPPRPSKPPPPQQSRNDSGTRAATTTTTAEPAQKTADSPTEAEVDAPLPEDSATSPQTSRTNEIESVAEREPPSERPPLSADGDANLVAEGSRSGGIWFWIVLLLAACAALVYLRRHRPSRKRRRRRSRRTPIEPRREPQDAGKVLQELQNRENAMKRRSDGEIVEAEFVEIVEES